MEKIETIGVREMFTLGMKRDIEPLLVNASLECLNLGAGAQKIEGAQALDLPEWEASAGVIPRGDGSCSTVYAFHFLEHLTGAECIRMLREIERVLCTGGVCNIVVPYYNSAIAHQDLDHKCSFTEETWQTLFSNPYYEKNRETPWHFRVGTNIIVGVVERNLCLMTQLVKQ